MHQRTAKSGRTALAAVVIAVTSVAGCETSVEVNLGTDLPFTIWGMFNPKTNVHAIRVFEIGEQLRLVRPEPLDASVRSINLNTGETRTWRDSLIVLEDGDFRHVYWDSFPAPEGTGYRVEVISDDGEKSSASTTIPPPIALHVLEPGFQDMLSGKQFVRIEGDPPAMPRIDLTYNMVASNPETEVQHFVDILYHYETFPVLTEEGWMLEINLRREYLNIVAQLSERNLPTIDIQLYELDLDVHVGDKDWISPVGVIDPLALVEPGAFSNVENGFGFVGAGYVEAVSWRPPEELLERVGFTY